MTYAGFENSVETSRPVEVYTFTVGATSYRYTSSEDTVVLSLVSYAPEPIKRSRIGNSPEERNNVLEVEVPITNIFAQQYLAVVPGQRAKLTIQRYQRSDTPTPEVQTIFQGYVQSVAFVQQAKVAKIAALPIASALSRIIPRFTYQALCNHVLGDAGCQVNLNVPAFRLVSTITAASGNVITVAGAGGYAADFFTGGYVEALGGLDARLIFDHVGDNLTLLLPFPFDAVGQTVTLFAGCDHTGPTCKSKFNNILNYGGFMFISSKNIFATGLD